MPYKKIEIPGTANIKLIGGKIYMNETEEYQYQEVIEDFSDANIIRIATYNFGAFLDDERDILYQKLISARTSADVKIVLGVPDIRKKMRNENDWSNRLKESITQVRRCFSRGEIRINAFNHSKIIGTENRLYIGSQNISMGSRLNFESGVIISNPNIISDVYDDIFMEIWEKSIVVDDNLFERDIADIALYQLEQLTNYENEDEE